jgi:hypothetical protein
MAKKTTSNRSLWLIPLGIFLLGFLGRSLFYYRGVYIAPNVPTDQPEAVTIVHQAPQQSVNEPGSFSGLVVVDDAHINNFSQDEMSVLYGRITAAGGEIRLFNGHNPLSESLRGAKAFVVAVNVLSFDAEDALAVEAFVRNGGRLLLIGDPTRVVEANTLNTLAGRFGVLYQGDYIYNLTENDGSYLNVYVRDFAESPLTDGVGQLVLRAAGSLRASGDVLAAGDDNTYSSLREAPGDVVAMALTHDGNVLAITDMTFLTAPYNTFGDNDRFIDNMVAFLLGGQRAYQLLDFPNIFGERVDLVFPHSGLLEQNFEQVGKLRQLLSGAGLGTQLADAYGSTTPAIVLDLYGELDSATSRRLNADGIDFESGVNIDGVGAFSASGTTLFHLHQDSSGAYQLFILADSAKSLADGLQILLDGKLDQCGLTDQTALCIPGSVSTPTPTPDGSATPDGTTTPEASGTPDGSPTPTATPTASG